MPLLRLDPHALYTAEAVSAECRKPRVAQQLKNCVSVVISGGEHIRNLAFGRVRL